MEIPVESLYVWKAPMHRYLLAIVSVSALWLVSSAPANAQQFSAKLSGFNEIGGLGAGETGAILSEGEGTLTANLDRVAQTLTYTLTFSGLSADVTQAHIHFGKEHVAGGIFVFLCTNLGNGPAGTPACPPTGGTVSGTLTAASVIAVPGQNIAAGDFDAVEDALTSNTAYVNVHTVKFPAGEIRGQVTRSEDDQGQNGD
jgi:CHRD domain